MGNKKILVKKISYFKQPTIQHLLISSRIMLSAYGQTWDIKCEQEGIRPLYVDVLLEL